MRFFSLFSLILCGFLVIGHRNTLLQAASSDAEAVIGECQKRTGMGRESCIGFIKKYMNVERCQEYAKLSASDCEKKLEEIRKSPEFQPKTGSVSPTPSTQAPRTDRTDSPLPSAPVSGLRTFKERVLEVKRDREGRLTLVQDETEKIIRFFEEQGRDVNSLREQLGIFVDKKEAVLLAYDQYARFSEEAPESRPPMEEPRRIVNQLLREAVDYYRTVLLSELRRVASIETHE